MKQFPLWTLLPLGAGLLLGRIGAARFSDAWPYWSGLCGLLSAAWLAWAQWGPPTSWLNLTLATLALASGWTISQAACSLRRLGQAEWLLGFCLRLSFFIPIVVGLLLTLWSLSNWGLSHSALCLAGLQGCLLLVWLATTGTAQLHLAFFGLVGLVAGAGLEKLQPSTWDEESTLADPIVLVYPTPWQRILMTRQGPELRLYRDGQMRLTNLDQHRYFESLVHPALSRLPLARRVAVLGGGDGLAAHQILAYPQVEEIILVDPDAQASRLFRTHPALTSLNRHALDHAKVQLKSIDPLLWVRQTQAPFDCIFVDFPDPSNESLAKLYSVGFFQALRQRLHPAGLLALQATSSRFAPRTYGTILASLRQAGFQVTPYQVYIPSLGEWGFALAFPGNATPMAGPLPPDLHYLSGPNLSKLFSPPKDQLPVWGHPHHLHNNVLPELFLSEVQVKP